MRTLYLAMLMGALVPVGHGQGITHDSQVTIDVVENDRRCRNDSGILRECNVAYGHYKAYDTWTKKNLVFRITMLCERQNRSCIAFEAGKTYQWSPAAIDERYPYTWYEDFYYGIYLVTPQGRALYACRDERSVRQ
jgi:hypothetical protein